MKSLVRTGWMKWNAQFEGNVPFLYLDNHKKPDGTPDPLVTIAVGNLADPIEMALSLPLFHIQSIIGAQYGAEGPEPATREEITAEWHLVKSRVDMAPHGGLAFGAITHLRLTDEGVEQVVLSKLASVDAHLLQRYGAAYEALPWQAQQALLSMCWAAGEHAKWPKFDVALAAGDWATCAKECHLDDTHNPGLKPRNKANSALFMGLILAASTEELPLDRQNVALPDEELAGPVAKETGACVADGDAG